MKTIPLTQDKFALVDDGDFAELSKHRWYARKDLNTYYAQRKEKVGNKWVFVHMHRVIAGTPDGMKTDHIDGNGLNNQRSNLRIVTHQENMMNMRKRKDNTSGYKNIYWHKREGKWMVMMNYKNKTYYAGDYKDLEDAKNALKKLRQDLGV